MKATKRRIIKQLHADKQFREAIRLAKRREELGRTRADGSTYDFALLVCEELRVLMGDESKYWETNEDDRPL